LINIELKYRRFSEYALIEPHDRSDFDSAITWFEPRRPSEPVPRFSAVSGLLINGRLFRGLTPRQAVSAAERLSSSRSIRQNFRASLWSRFFDIQFFAA
jgi:hypothetical protein